MSAAARRVRIVDVFNCGPLPGNPLAVVHDAEGMSESQMLAFARWMNLSETTFLLYPSRPETHYRVRIFTPDGEMGLAGHPTLGSCHAWLEEQITPPVGERILQECRGGLVEVRRTEDGLAPPRHLCDGVVRFGEDLVARIAALLGIEPQEILAAGWVDNGAGWAGVLLHDAETVLRLTPRAVDWTSGSSAPQRRRTGRFRGSRVLSQEPRDRGGSGDRQSECRVGAVADRRRASPSPIRGAAGNRHRS